MSWWRLALAGALCMALSSGLQPWVDALGGAFIPADIAQDTAAARLFVQGVDPYGPVIREAHADLLDVPVEGTFPHFPHPPFSLLISLPLAFGAFQTAAILWFAWSIALTFVLAVLMASAWGSEANEAGGIGLVWRMWGLLLLWPPVLYNLEKGQWSLLLAVLLALAWSALARANWRATGIWAGAAAAVKVYPLVLGGYFLLRSWKGLLSFVATGFILTALPLLQIGPAAMLGFIRESRLNMPYWETFPSVTFSIHGALARLFIGGQWAEPLVHAPALAVMIEALVVALLLGAAGWVTVLARRGQADESLAFAAWLVLLPTLNPQSLGHNGVLLALPIVIVARHLAREGRLWQKWAWAISVVLVSVPRQTVWRLAPPPVGPLEGLLLVALPTWGTLLLFVVVAVLAVELAARRCTSSELAGRIPGEMASRRALVT